MLIRYTLYESCERCAVQLVAFDAWRSGMSATLLTC